ncbi:MAG: aspartate carbamoyltransferase [Candidatus Kerfeldbacteria bacterium]|nr:aspartate carbamoyltransferase [Candidatus Kerfeldbacteria bacterium]
MKHFISTADTTRDEIQELVSWAKEHIDPFLRREQVHHDKRATLLFAEPSTRTRGSYELAAKLTGFEVDPVTGAEATSLMKEESLSATARMFARYHADILVIRTSLAGGARWVAEMLGRYGYHTAVHNAGDESNQHPSQAILDLLTLRQEFGRLENLTIGIVGDLKNSRTVHSLAWALRGFPGIRLVLVSSPEVALQPWYTEGLEVTVSDSLDALAGCNVVYVTRVQRERFANAYDYARVRGKFVVDATVLERLGPNVKIMHPQPIADGEVAPEIWSHPQVIMDQQAQLGVPARMMLLRRSLKYLPQPPEVEGVSPREEQVSDDHAAQTIARKHDASLRYIPLETGTVIDHLGGRAVPAIKACLGIQDHELDRHQVDVIGGLETRQLPSGCKCIIRLNGRFLTPAERAAIAFLAPTATFNEIRDGRRIKSKVRDPHMLRGAGQCPNPACVTRHDPEAALHPAFHGAGDGDQLVWCHYCEQRFPREQLFAN